MRNHDEVDLSRLTAEQRHDVFAKFGPDENMQLYGRGIRRRLASMLGNDRRHVELAYALQFSLRGTPVLRYGEEIGMGEDLSQNGRNAIRTPMQWSVLPNGGFSTAPREQLVRPVISGGEYGFEKVNVTAQRHDPASLLSWFERMIRTLREAPEVGSGTCTHVDVPVPSGVLVHRSDDITGTMVFVHNLCNNSGVVDLSSLAAEAEYPNDVLADQEYPEPGKLDAIQIGGYGHRWIRLRRHL
jgi:maltose alpha-D-glucosyltransferase/alpha-amylase